MRVAVLWRDVEAADRIDAGTSARLGREHLEAEPGAAPTPDDSAVERIDIRLQRAHEVMVEGSVVILDCGDRLRDDARAGACEVRGGVGRGRAASRERVDPVSRQRSVCELIGAGEG